MVSKKARRKNNCKTKGVDMSNFSKAKKYYTKSEVEEALKMYLGKSELKLAEQNSAIVGLSAKAEKQEQELKELKKRERIIRNALVLATDEAKKAHDEAKNSRNNDILRLEQLAVRLKAENVDSKNKSLAQIADEMMVIARDLKAGVGVGELARRKELERARAKLEEANTTAKINQKSIEERYKNVLEKYQELCDKNSSSDGFSIEEALNPSASLEDIMKEIFKK